MTHNEARRDTDRQEIHLDDEFADEEDDTCSMPSSTMIALTMLLNVTICG